MSGTLPNPSAAAIRERFGDAWHRSAVSCGDTIVWVAPERIGEPV